MSNAIASSEGGVRRLSGHHPWSSVPWRKSGFPLSAKRSVPHTSFTRESERIAKYASALSSFHEKRTS